MTDRTVAAEKLRLVDQYTEELREMRDVPRDEYLADVMRQRAVERSFMNAIQACIDIAEHVRAAEALAPDDRSKEAVEALGDAGIVSAETETRLIEAVGFRNVLAHRYRSIDHDVVYDLLHEDVAWLERFQREVARWLAE